MCNINLAQMETITQQTVYYQAIGKEITIFEHAYQQKLPLLLKGPTGCGKTRFVEYMAQTLNRELITVSCNEETSSIDLVGRYLVKGMETIWQDGPLTKAVKSGAILYLDEIAEARPDVMVVIHALTDHRRMLYIDRLDEKLYATDTFMLVASYNPGYQSGLKELKPSTKQRFISMQFNYPTPEVESEIILNETGIDKTKAQKLVKIGTKIRNLVELGLSEPASTRLLIDAAKLINSGIEPRLACEVAITQPLSDDKETCDALSDLISMIF
jgi:nitric oxide reductase NorQ protein